MPRTPRAKFVARLAVLRRAVPSDAVDQIVLVLLEALEHGQESALAEHMMRWDCPESQLRLAAPDLLAACELLREGLMTDQELASSQRWSAPLDVLNHAIDKAKVQSSVAS